MGTSFVLLGITSCAYSWLLYLLNSIDIFAFSGSVIFSEYLPDKFGSPWKALFTMVQIMTLDDWTTLYDDPRIDTTSVYRFHRNS